MKSSNWIKCANKEDIMRSGDWIKCADREDMESVAEELLQKGFMITKDKIDNVIRIVGEPKAKEYEGRWYEPSERLPKDGFVVCSVSGRAGKVTYNHVLEVLHFDADCGWCSFSTEFDELTVHAWTDLEPF